MIKICILGCYWLTLFSIHTLTYKVLHGSAPPYLGLLVPVADLQGRRTLRSAVINRLVVPSVRLSTVAGLSRLLLHASGTACQRRRRQLSR